MARWSDAMKLSDYKEYETYLLVPGVYEIGYIQRETFYPKYIGKAPVTLYQRIRTYGRDLGRSSHNASSANWSRSIITASGFTSSASAAPAGRRCARLC